MNEITHFLAQVRDGNKFASESLLPLMYQELRQLAAARMAHEQKGHTIQATALVHEAYLRLVEGDREEPWDSRGHFFAAAAEAMRRILVDRARKKNAIKHGGNIRTDELFEVNCPANLETPDRLVAIDEALENIEKQHPDAALVLKLRYFAGMSLVDTASVLGISQATAKRRWALARAFLFDQLDLKH